MHPKNVVVLMIAITVLVLLILSSFFIHNRSKTDSFSLDEYQSYLDSYPSDRFVEPISNESIAVHQAEALWVEIYGEAVLENKPYTVLFDSTNDVWLITGCLTEGHLGGIPYAIIQSDGKVLSVWHSK